MFSKSGKRLRIFFVKQSWKSGKKVKSRKKSKRSGKKVKIRKKYKRSGKKVKKIFNYLVTANN